jgi:multicomponent Na+:H+ antiporter subunit G
VIVVSTVLMLVGLFFLVVSSIGLARLPEVYTRAHAVAKSETLGLLLVFAGLFFRPELDAPAAVRLVAIAAFSVLANPTAVHALVRAARRDGVQSWRSKEPTGGSTTTPDTGGPPSPGPSGAGPPGPGPEERT